VAVDHPSPFLALLTGCSRSSRVAVLVVLAALVQVDGQGGRRWVDGARWSWNPDERRRRGLEVPQALAQRRHRAVAADGARLDRLLANPEQRAGTLLLVAHPLDGEDGVQLAPASRLPDDRRGIIDRDPLGAPLAGALLQVLGSP
jgi:hypothetical protein